jgi:hypothetical protein
MIPVSVLHMQYAAQFLGIGQGLAPQANMKVRRHGLYLHEQEEIVIGLRATLPCLHKASCYSKSLSQFQALWRYPRHTSFGPSVATTTVRSHPLVLGP